MEEIKTILHIFRTYASDQSLKNDIVESCHGAFKNVVCYLIGEDDGENRMSRVADEVIYLNLDSKVVSWRNSSCVRAVADIINTRNVDIVDCHMWRAMPIGVLAAARSERQPKIVGVFHGVKESLSLRMKLLYYFMMRRMDKIVSVSEGGIEDIKSLFWRVDANKLVAIPNGLDFTDFLSAKAGDRAALFGEQFAGRRIVITVSRLADKKNLERFLRAFADMGREHPDSGLVIVGTGPRREQLEALVAELELSGSVVFLGYREDIPTLLKTADLYAIPSLREGLPRSLVEAMAVGKPVLASRINGQEEVVTDFEHGRLVNPLDIGDMASALGYFMKLDEAELRRLGAAARDQVLKNYNRELMMAKYRHLFLELA